MATAKVANVARIYECLICDYTTTRKNNYTKHLSTSIHGSHTSATIGHNIATFKCENCDKTYKDRTGLWKHKKKCKIENNHIYNSKTNDEPQTDKELIMLLIKENSEFKTMMLEQNKQMMEIAKNAGHNTTNSHNKAFNLNFFLNETCKDAMNITEFVNSIQLQLSDLERMGEVGYVEGLSSIISRNLKALDVNMRPVHCTDKKREIMYIKDETKWEKDEENTKMHKMVKNVAFENQRQILKYKEIHPDCGKSTSKFSDAYNKILVECMGGPGDNDFEKEEKIISKISKCVLVEKDPSL
jgi:hypothetical protein